MMSDLKIHRNYTTRPMKFTNDIQDRAKSKHFSDDGTRNVTRIKSLDEGREVPEGAETSACWILLSRHDCRASIAWSNCDYRANMYLHCLELSAMAAQELKRVRNRQFPKRTILINCGREEEKSKKPIKTYAIILELCNHKQPQNTVGLSSENELKCSARMRQN
jgi:hypothetical protein